MDVSISCQCPGEHVTDTVTFYDRLDFRRATTITKALSFIENTDPVTRPAEVLAVLSEYYLLYGIESWTLVGPDRKKLEVNPAAIRSQLLEHPDVSVLVEAADEQYQEQVLLPLVRRAASSSRPSQTDEPTSPTPLSNRQSRRRSRPSSTSTIPTAGTETTSSSLDGVSNSSQSSESAA
jgi:hypothetical protein